MWNSNAYVSQVCKIDEYLDILDVNCSCEKCVIGKFVLACKNEILNNKTFLDDKKGSM